MVTTTTKQTGPAEIATKNIVEHPQNPRQDFPAEEMAQLAASIKREGLLQRIVVRPIARGKFQLLAGERRWRACQVAGMKTIACEVRHCDDATALRILLTENLERKDLNAIEVARGLAALIRAKNEGGAGMTSAEVGVLHGKSASWVNKSIALLALPEKWQRRIIAGDLAPTAAEALCPIAKQPEALAMVEEGMKRNPSSFATRDDFIHSVRLITNNFRNLTRPPADDDGDDDDAGGESKAGGEHDGNGQLPKGARPTTQGRRAAPVNMAARGGRKDHRGGLLAIDDVQMILLPYSESRPDLESIRDHAMQLLEDLPA